MSNKSLEVSIGGFSSKGIKPENQDAFAVHNSQSVSELTYKGVAACLADGVSCSKNAQNASQTSVTQFINDYYSTPDSWSVKQSAARVLISLNSWLYHHSHQADAAHHDGWVTTFSSAVFKSTTAHIFHVGDSRIYCLRRGNLEQLSRDHCHKHLGSKSFLSRALGMDSHLEVDYLQHDLEEGDVYFFSTDGVHDWLSEMDLIATLSSTGDNLEAVAKTLVNKALANGSDDNVSCLLVRVESLPAADLDEVSRQLTELTIPPVLDVGNRIDDFEVLKTIYSGTRSHLYLVEKKACGQRYLLKAPSQNFAEDPVYLEGFIREQWVGQRLNNPGVMKIYPRPSSSPFLYHLCEYIEGITLRQWMHDNPKPEFERVREITAGIVRSIRAFQRMGMVHRDLKPENIMINSRGQVVVIDFGTVQVESLGEITSPLDEDVPVGSVDYIAPEYLHGEKGQHYSDIFSLGVIVYEMLTGGLPYEVSAAQQQAPQRYQKWRYISARTRRKEIPQWLDLTLEKACQVSPLKRYHVLSEFESDLSKANQQMINAHKSAPLLERNPVAFWKMISAICFAIALVEAWLLSQ
ncbi:MAG: bifunctional protein-serine/threonine kinase/phosphatase [Candidatus Pelagadaptatus aseana]|uniref:protein kinase domain-containing protein n=1 Tax=Candidatus Pelagadaptatus aseana TaxID=3120508 RepID=UPI0039B1A761